MSWQLAVLRLPTFIARRVARIDVRLCMENATGVINITDVMLQGGMLITAWNGHTSEIRFSLE